MLSIPNHRPQPGFNAGYRALTATDLRAARAELARHGVDWILLCPSIVERGQFTEGREGEATLYRRLLDGTAPAWLRAVGLGEELRGSMQLFEIDPGAGPGTDLSTKRP